MSDDAAPVQAEPAPARIGAPVRPPAPTWSRVLLLALGHFTNDLYASFLAPLLPLAVAKFNLSLALAGLLGTVFNTSGAFAQPLFGMLADRLRRPIFSAVGPLLTVLGMGFLGLAPSYELMLVLLLAAGVGTAGFHPQSFALAGAYSGDRRGTGLAIFVTGGEFGYSVGPLFVAAIVSTSLGLGGTIVAAVPGLIACLFIFLVTRAWPSSPMQTLSRLRSDFGRHGRLLALLWIVVVLRSIITMSHILFLPLLLRSRGESLILGAAAVLLFGGVGSLGGLTGGLLADRIGRRAIMAMSFIWSVPLLLLFNKMSGDWALLPLALGGFGLYLSAPVNVVMAQELLPARASLASSLVTGMSWGTAGLSLTVIGAIADRIGLSATLMATLGLAIPGLLAVWALPERRP